VRTHPAHLCLVLEQAGTSYCDSVLREPRQLTCRQSQSQASSSPLHSNIRSGWSFPLPLPIALWPLCCIRLSPASCPRPLFPEALPCCLLHRGLPNVPSSRKQCPYAFPWTRPCPCFCDFLPVTCYWQVQRWGCCFPSTSSSMVSFSPILAVGLCQLLLLLPGLGEIEVMSLISTCSLGSQPFPGHSRAI